MHVHLVTISQFESIPRHIKALGLMGFVNWDDTWYGQQRNSPPPFPQSQAPSSDWTLTVRPVNLPFGDSTIHISIKGPFGYTNFRNIPMCYG